MSDRLSTRYISETVNTILMKVGVGIALQQKVSE